MGKKLLIVTSVVKFNPLAIVFIFNYKVLQLANMLEQVQFDDTSVYISIKKDLYSQACKYKLANRSLDWVHVAIFFIFHFFSQKVADLIP